MIVGFRTSRARLANTPHVAVVLILFLLSCSQQPLYERARIEIEPDTADFGTISGKDPIPFHDAAIILRNRGAEPLKVERVEYPDGFSHVIVPRDIIDPGEEGTLRLTVNIKKVSGAVSETAYIVTNDPDRPRLPVRLVADIEGEPGTHRYDVSEGPDIAFDHKVHAFGHVGRNEVREHTFPFKNLGRKTLEILEIETGCLCATAIPTLWKVPPGGSADLVVKLEAYKYPGREPIKSLVITTNDPDEPTVSLTITAMIVDMAALEPEEVLLPGIPSHKPASFDVKLIQQGMQPLKIRDVTTSSPMVSAEHSPLTGEENGYLIHVTISPEMPEGTFDELVNIHTNYSDYSANPSARDNAGGLYKDYSTLVLPVKGSVVGAITITPRTVNFGSTTPAEPLQRKLVVSSRSVTFEIESLTVSNPGFRASSHAIEPGRKYEIAVEFHPGDRAEKIEDTLVIMAAGRRFEVPVFATVRLDESS